MTKKLIKLLLVVAWMALIFVFSHDTGEVSTKKSDGIIINTMEFLLERDLTDAEKEKWIGYLVVPVRKGAHIITYFILGYLMISLLKEFRLIDKRTFIFAIILCILYSISDEVHQHFVPGRSGEVLDVAIDTIGSCLGIWNWGYKWKMRERRKELNLLRQRRKKQVKNNE